MDECNYLIADIAYIVELCRILVVYRTIVGEAEPLKETHERPCIKDIRRTYTRASLIGNDMYPEFDVFV
jgi:hypothetical protein